MYGSHRLLVSAQGTAHLIMPPFCSNTLASIVDIYILKHTWLLYLAFCKVLVLWCSEFRATYKSKLL